jgi:hypothetical protein
MERKSAPTLLSFFIILQMLLQLVDLIPSLSYPLDTSSARGHVALEGERGCDLTASDLGGSATSAFRVRVGE